MAAVLSTIPAMPERCNWPFNLSLNMGESSSCNIALSTTMRLLLSTTTCLFVLLTEPMFPSTQCSPPLVLWPFLMIFSLTVNFSAAIDAASTLAFSSTSTIPVEFTCINEVRAWSIKILSISSTIANLLLKSSKFSSISRLPLSASATSRSLFTSKARVSAERKTTPFWYCLFFSDCSIC